MSPVVPSKLKGSNEAPAKGDPNDAGFVVVTFEAAKGMACWEFKGVKGIATPNGHTSTTAGAVWPGPS